MLILKKFDLNTVYNTINPLHFATGVRQKLVVSYLVLLHKTDKIMSELFKTCAI